MFNVSIEYDAAVRMRDGVVLRADIYRSTDEGPWPVIVARTPYGKSDHYELQFLEPLKAARRGFIAVVQDVRGRFASEGEFVPFVHEGPDGADTIRWAAGLEDSTGAVGMWGLSYLGNVQWQAAASAPPALKAIAPERTFSTARDGLVLRGGARELGLTRSWGLGVGLDVLSRRSEAGDASADDIQGLVNALDDIPQHAFEEPLGEVDPVLTRWSLPDLAHPAVMAAAEVDRHHSRVDIPSLHAGGWFDVFCQGTIDNYIAAASRAPARLIMGPWDHTGWSSLQGDINFGLAGHGQAVELRTTMLDLTFDWLRQHLEVASPDHESGSPVMLYVMGLNEWRGEATWPLDRAVPTRMFLTDGAALVEDVTDEAGSSMTFVHDPANPVPTRGGATLVPPLRAGSVEQTSVGSRADVLVFTGPILSDDVEVTGRVTASLAVSGEAQTADWVVRLCDVHPDGTSYNVVDGITRSERTADGVQQVDVDLWSTSMVFKKGHRLRIQVTSSCFPRWDVNVGSTESPGVTPTPAAQTVHTSRLSPSYVTLPIIPST